MAKMKACNGRVTIGATPDVVGELRSWGHTNEWAEQDGSVMGVCEQEPVATNVRRDFEITCYFDPADAGQLAAVGGTTITLTIQPDGQGSGKPQFTGDATIFRQNYAADDPGGLVGFVFGGSFVANYDAANQGP